VKARIGAIEVLLREGLGRPAQAEEVLAPKLPTNVEAVSRLSWDDTQHLAALLLTDEIETVLARGGRGAVRERLEGLSDSERNVLSEALAELAHA
jgi:diacylglycerol kinase family enzyme